MKKLICLLLAAMLSLCLISCGDDLEEINPDFNQGENGEINFPIVGY
jgi:hypothetical protein